MNCPDLQSHINESLLTKGTFSKIQQTILKNGLDGFVTFFEQTSNLHSE